MNPDMGGMPMQGDESNDEELMEELLRAAEAGDDAEGEGFFSDVPGAEQSGDVSIEAEGVKPDMLAQLLQALQEKKENGDTGDLSAGMP